MTGRDQTAQAEIKADLERVRSLAEETTSHAEPIDGAGWTRSGGRGKNRPRHRRAAAEPDDGVPTPPTEAEMAAVAPTASDQRRSPRRAYRYRQSIAPMTDDSTARWPGGFFEVECWDISACGFSFFMEQLPKFETLVAALGRPPALEPLFRPRDARRPHDAGQQNSLSDRLRLH